MAENSTLPEFDLNLKLSRDEADKLGKKLKTSIEKALSARTGRDDRIKEWSVQYDAIVMPKNRPWKGAASLNIPTTRSIIDALHAHILKVMQGVKPLARIPEGWPGAEAETVDRVERFLDWQLNVQVDIPNVWDPVVHESLRTGNGIVEIGWRRIRSRRRDVVPVFTDPVTGDDCDADVPNATPKMNPRTGAQEMELVEETVDVLNQPVVTLINTLDWMMYPANAKSIEKAIGCGYRYWATKNDLLMGVRDGVYREEWVNALLAKGPSYTSRYDEASGGNPVIDQNVGAEEFMPDDDEDRPYELFKVVWLYDYDGDGIKEDCLFHIDICTGQLIAAQVYPYWHGIRCFESYTPYPRPGHFYGYSLCEILRSLHAERNAIRNQRIDAGTMALSPAIAVGRNARLDLSKNVWGPGQVWHCDTVEQIRPIVVTAASQQMFAEEAGVKEAAEDVSGVSAYSQGSSPSRSRTLGEISTIVSEGNLKFNVIIQRLQAVNNRVFTQIVGLDYQYLPVETEFAVTGPQQERMFAKVTRKELENRFRVVAQGNSANSNRELAIQTAETLFQIGQTNPLINGSLSRMWEVTNNYLRQAGITDPTPYIGTLEEAKEMEEQQKQAPPQVQVEPLRLSGRIDEVLTAALVLKEDPTLEGPLRTAVSIYRTAANALLQAQNAGAGPQDGSGAEPRTPNQMSAPGAIPPLPTDPAFPNPIPNQDINLAALQSAAMALLPGGGGQ